MILLTDTFEVDQLDVDATISVERYNVQEVQAALRGGFDTYFEFEELALDTQDALGVEVPETEQKHRPRFTPPFDLIFVAPVIVDRDDDDWTLAFWRVHDVA